MPRLPMKLNGLHDETLNPGEYRIRPRTVFVFIAKVNGSAIVNATSAPIHGMIPIKRPYPMPPSNLMNVFGSKSRRSADEASISWRRDIAMEEPKKIALWKK